MKRTGPTNSVTKRLIMELQRKHGIPLWHAVAHELLRSTRARREVNLSKLDQVTKENDVILIPGKVLGSGELTHKLTIVAFAVSQIALTKIKQSGSTYMKIPDAIVTNPEGTGIRIIG